MVSSLYPVELLFGEGPYIHFNRENLVEEALKRNKTHLLFIDDDVGFPTGGMEQLISANVPIIGAPYAMRRESSMHLSTVGFIDPDIRPVKMSEMPEYIFECDWLGMGFTLINLEVFKKVPQPWFEYQHIRGKLAGEDIDFCVKAKKAGYQILCEPRIKLLHIGDYAYR